MISTRTVQFIALVRAAICCCAAQAQNSDSSAINIPAGQTVGSETDLATIRHLRWSGDQLPVRPINSLNLELKTPKRNHFVRVRGTAMSQGLGEFVLIQDETGNIRVGTRQTFPIGSNVPGPVAQTLGVIEIASWWNAQHTSIVTSALMVIILGGATWTATLRRKVRQQTASLRESELKFRSLVERSLVGVYVIQDGRFAYVNPRLAEIFGYDASEFVSTCKVENLVAPEDLPKVKEQMRRRLSGEVVSGQYDFRGRRKDGSLIHVEVLCSCSEYDGKPALLGTVLDISERKLAEEKLFDSQRMLRTILDTIPQAVFWKDRNSVYTGCNVPFANYCGYEEPGALVGKTDDEIRSVELAKLHRADDQRVMESGVARFCYEELHIKPDGTQCWSKASKVPLFDQDGNVSGLLGTCEDITERRHADAELAKASSLLETMLANSPDRIYFKDVESRFVRYSKSFSDFHLLTNETNLVGKSDFDLFTEEHARPAYEDEQQIIRTGEPLVGKLEKETHNDGRTSWALTNKLPWRDDSGNIIGTFGISKDVTAIKETEERLAYERELFRSLLDNFPDAIYFKDRECRFVRFSRSKAEKTFHIVKSRLAATRHAPSPGQLPAHLASLQAFSEYLIGKTDFDTYEEGYALGAFEEEQTIMRTGNPIISKLEHGENPDGSFHWWLITKMPWRDKEGNVIGTYGVSRDITTHRDAETKLEAARQRLIETSRLAGMAEVATDVLHNVGNVLNSVNVSCSLAIDRIKTSKISSLSKVSSLLHENRGRLAEFLADDPRGQQLPGYVSALAEHLVNDQTMLVKELEQLLRHIDHIKQIVAMQQSYAKVAGVRELISPSQLIEDALHINAAALARHDVHVSREISEAPPILTERHKVLQILVNLIRNAKYAMDESKRQDKLLTLKAGPDGNGSIRVQVTDNGVGIPRENLTRIFAHGFTTRPDGHGFGLHSSALAVRDLGGSLEVHSEGEGKGATFTLLLPCNSTIQNESAE